MVIVLLVEYFLNQWVFFFKLSSINHCDKLKNLLDLELKVGLLCGGGGICGGGDISFSLKNISSLLTCV